MQDMQPEFRAQNYSVQSDYTKWEKAFNMYTVWIDTLYSLACAENMQLFTTIVSICIYNLSPVAEYMLQ